MFDGITFNAKPASEARMATQDEIDALVRRAQAERARVIGEMLANAIVGTIKAVRRWNERRVAERELVGMDDRLLSDMGITRADIKQLIHGAPHAAAVARGDMLVDFVDTAIVRPFRRWRLRARTEAELSALDDSMLRDIGIERGQIAGIAEAVANGQGFTRAPEHTARLVEAASTAPVAANANVRRPAPAALIDAAD